MEERIRLQNQRHGSMRWIQSKIAGFGKGREKPQEAERGKEAQSPLEPPEKTQSCQHLNLT